MKGGAMTIETVAQADRQLASAFLRMTQAFNQLNIPDSDDVAVDWRAILAQIDEYGDACHALMLLARDTAIPALKAVKAHAQSALAEVSALDALVSAEPVQDASAVEVLEARGTGAPAPTETVPPRRRRILAGAPLSVTVLGAARDDQRLTDGDRRVLRGLVALANPATGRTTMSRANVASRLGMPELDVATATMNLRAVGYLSWSRPDSKLPNTYSFHHPTPAEAPRA
jgi:hypothetical protein